MNRNMSVRIRQVYGDNPVVDQYCLMYWFDSLHFERLFHDVLI